VQVVIEDYVESEGSKVVSILLNKFTHAIVAAAGIFAVLKIALT
jgi:succinate dehydrogenase / fumarate reductase membrane anchor subunit